MNRSGHAPAVRFAGLDCTRCERLSSRPFAGGTPAS
jgi:hypothetical protein